MPKAPRAPATPTAKQRQVLKTLAHPDGRAFVVHHAGSGVYGDGDAYLELFPSGLTETVLVSTFRALERQQWIDEIREWSETGVTYWTISDAGREALQ